MDASKISSETQICAFLDNFFASMPGMLPGPLHLSVPAADIFCIIHMCIFQKKISPPPLMPTDSNLYPTKQTHSQNTKPHPSIQRVGIQNPTSIGASLFCFEWSGHTKANRSSQSYSIPTPCCFRFYPTPALCRDSALLVACAKRWLAIVDPVRYRAFCWGRYFDLRMGGRLDSVLIPSRDTIKS